MKRGNDVPEIRMRLGVLVGGKKLDIEVPKWTKEEIRQRIGEGDVIDALRIIYAHIEFYRMVIKAYTSTVKKLASERGMTVSVGQRSCNIKRCGTCMGKYQAHYPMFVIVTKDGHRTVRTEHRRDFLRQFISEEEIGDFEKIIDLHNIWWQVHNYFEVWAEKSGTKEPEVEEIEQRATI